MYELFEVGDYVSFEPEGEGHRIYGHVLAVVLDKSNYAEPRCVVEYAIVDSNSIIYWVPVSDGVQSGR